MSEVEFQKFGKIARLSREIVITEKIDGTNAQVYVGEDGEVRAGSRKRWITPEDDNFGFAAWVRDHEDELRTLGPGRHFGEWWGKGIQRNYGLDGRRFSMFNVLRWSLHGEGPREEPTRDPLITRTTKVLPPCVGLVPVLSRGVFSEVEIMAALNRLRLFGSEAVPGFMKPEGVVVYHTASGALFKKTIEKDDEPKGMRGKA